VPEIIKRDELKVRMDSGGKFVLLDVRDTPDYDTSHLPGAVHMLITDMNQETLQRFNKDTMIITYSEDEACPASRIAAEKLEKTGFKVLNYQASFEDWKKAGYPLE